MDQELNTISKRYYVCEGFLAILFIASLFSQFFGLQSKISISFLEYSFNNPVHFVRAILLLQTASIVWLFIEAVQIGETKNWKLFAFRFWGIIIVTVLSACLSYQTLVAGTFLAGYSGAWFLIHIAGGLLIAFCVDGVISSLRIIRTKKESEELGLPRVPFISVAQLRFYTPVLLIVLSAYGGIVYWVVPPEIRRIGVTVAFILLIVESFIAYFENFEGVLRKHIDRYDYDLMLLQYQTKNKWNTQKLSPPDKQIYCRNIAVRNLLLTKSKHNNFYKFSMLLCAKYSKTRHIPLFDAVLLGDITVVQALLKGRCDINRRQASGWTVLLNAVANGYNEIAAVLLEHGANPDIPNLIGITPLIYAAHYGNLDSCKLLLHYGAKIDAKTLDGDTALIVAIKRRCEEVALFLIEAGADIHVKDNADKNPLFYAEESGLGEIARIIRVRN
jgi:hypothetical protein